MKDKRGFTLIELIISIALLSTVFILAGNILFVSTNVFEKSKNQTAAQFDLRVFQNSITNQIRYANQIEILDAIPESFDSQKRYIYTSGNQVMYKAENQTASALEGMGALDSLSLLFTKSGNTSVEVKLEGSVSEQDYDLNTNVEAINLKGKDEATRIMGLIGPVVAITYSSDEKNMVLFNFEASNNPGLSADVIGRITSDTIKLYVPSGTDISDLVPTFISTGIEVKVGTSTQTSGSNHIDFSGGNVTYTVYAQDGTSKTYTVEVHILPDTPPSADAVRINAHEGTADGPITPVAWDTSVLVGQYTYISNGNGDEGDSKYQWYVADDEEGPYTLISGADKIELSAEFYTDKWLKFAVNPVSEAGVEGGWILSDPIQVYENNNNRLWKKMVEDLWYLNATDEEREDFEQALFDAGQPPYEPTVEIKIRQEILNEMAQAEQDAKNQGKTEAEIQEAIDKVFKVVANVKEQSLEVSGTKHYDGVHFSINLDDFVDDLDSYSMVFDTQLVSEGIYQTNGWGMSLDATIDYLNRDASYMFQFDPGASGFVVRRNNYNHNVVPELGVNQTDDGNLSGIAATYNPTDIVSDGFTWTGSNSNSNVSQWTKDYSTELTIQRQLDGSMIYRAVTWETAKGRESASQEMWFGDFDSISYNGKTFEGFEPYSTSNNVTQNKSLYPHYDISNGTYLGIRTWAPGGKMFKAIFTDLNVEDGFSMNILDAKFLVDTVNGNTYSNKVVLQFDQPIRESDFNINLMHFNGAMFENGSLQIVGVERMPGTDDTMIVKFNRNIKSAVYTSSAGQMHNEIERGSVRQEHAGDILINNGDDFTIKGIMTNTFRLDANAYSNSSIIYYNNYFYNLSRSNQYFDDIDHTFWIDPVGIGESHFTIATTTGRYLGGYKSGGWWGDYYISYDTSPTSYTNWVLETVEGKKLIIKSERYSNYGLYTSGNPTNGAATDLSYIQNNNYYYWTLEKMENE